LLLIYLFCKGVLALSFAGLLFYLPFDFCLISVMHLKMQMDQGLFKTLTRLQITNS